MIIALGIPTMFVLFFLIVRREMDTVGKVGTQDVGCPRCEASPRTSAGWCAACTTLLVTHPPGPDHPIHRYLGTARGDLDGLARCVADRVVVRQANGQQSDLSRGAWRRTLRFTRRVYPHLRSELLGLYVEPENVDVVWMHSTDRGAGRFWFHDLDLRLVTRLRFTHDLISEFVFSPALPTAPTMNVATTDVGTATPAVPPASPSGSVGPPTRR
ncbi:MAG: nuclear transport factor 2 family protein [Solirubrobacteraceae bacterium]|nr:nuclear transport factor 2 family protein [Solirubrobacteraceae bacterium]